MNFEEYKPACGWHQFYQGKFMSLKDTLIALAMLAILVVMYAFCAFVETM